MSRSGSANVLEVPQQVQVQVVVLEQVFLVCLLPVLFQEEILVPAVIVPVGETEPSFFGHHDLYSTPLNWVSDWFAPYPAEEPPDDYAGPAEATGIVIARGTPAAQARYPYPVEADLSLEVWPFVHPVGVRCAFDEQPPPMAP